MLHDLPDGLDNQQMNEATDEATLAFLQAQQDTEISSGRFSASFGPKLLPGMIAQPVFSVPKPGSAKFRLVNDHTAGIHSLNSAIPTHEGTFQLDNLSDLGALLIAHV